ncbi:MerR family transcriptional regulator [Ferruginibacter lapsinanis]|uniref:MerR family transcriptional regulator n=1 Tax=Ferruginibacter lapsinanis TaxID=563172 RepID=UPI001E2C119C|nr:MerR family transcriptional regulator [Ferruginibacter lapsinanis]UEG50547.1 MerR family transcriptional regulator [Ferruginibacter lapsinanis]
MNSFTIKDLENLSGVKAHTIRIWEQRYNFLKPDRTETNIRYYSNAELKQLLNIALLNKYGFKISHINKMNIKEVNEKILSLTNAEALQERIVNELIQHMIDMDIEGLGNVLDKYIMSKGIERTITQIVFPFLEKIGILWVTNHINPAQEHLVSNLIRQKLIVGIDGIVTSINTDKKVLLFLPEGEHHELGLLFINYLLRRRGVATIYLGANIPMQDVDYVVKLKKPTHIYSHLTAISHSFNFDKFISTLTKWFAGTPVIISGQLTTTYSKKIPAPIAFKKSLSSVMDFITSL